MKKIFNAVLTVILLIIIIGGLGYIGYNTFYVNHQATNHTSPLNPDNEILKQPDSNNQNQNSPYLVGQGSVSTPAVYNNFNFTIQNKEALDRAIQLVNEAREFMIIDSLYSSESNQQSQPAQVPSSEQAGTVPEANQQGDTVINIYPSSPNPASPSNDNSSGIGSGYNANRMQQLHSGLYKMAVGMQLLDLLSEELGKQIQQTNVKIQDPAQYYAGLYNLSVQNKGSLNNALNYLNQAPSLADINPYMDSNGYVYDQEKMSQIHMSVNKLAQGMVALNKLNDDLMKQSVLQYNEIQNVYTNSQYNPSSHSMNGSSILDNLNSTSVVTILLIAMVVLFIIGIFGFILNLLKPSNQAQRIEGQRQEL